MAAWEKAPSPRELADAQRLTEGEPSCLPRRGRQEGRRRPSRLVHDLAPPVWGSCRRRRLRGETTYRGGRLSLRSGRCLTPAGRTGMSRRGQPLLTRC